MWGQGKIQVNSHLAYIQDRLAQDFPVSAIYRSLVEKKQLTISYEQFNRLVRKCKKASNFYATPTIPLKTRGGTPREALAFNKKEQTFKHDPLPSRDYFAKGGGS
jgi:hypothetical protein